MNRELSEALPADGERDLSHNPRVSLYENHVTDLLFQAFDHKTCTVQAEVLALQNATLDLDELLSAKGQGRGAHVLVYEEAESAHRILPVCSAPLATLLSSPHRISRSCLSSLSDAFDIASRIRKDITNLQALRTAHHQFIAKYATGGTEKAIRLVHNRAALLEQSLGSAYTVHVIVDMPYEPKEEGASTGNTRMVIPIHSELFAHPLSSKSSESRDCIIALSDVFDIVRSYNRNIPKVTVASRPSSSSSPPHISIPPWLTASPPERAIRSDPARVFVKRVVYEAILAHSPEKIKTAYANFFTYFFNCSKSASAVRKGPFRYKLITPPWLRYGAYFIDIEEKSTLHRRLEDHLPPSRITQTAEGKSTAASILAAWLQYEQGSNEALKYFLRTSDIHIPLDAQLLPLESQELAPEHFTPQKRDIESEVIEEEEVIPVVDLLTRTAVPERAGGKVARTVHGVQILRQDIDRLILNEKIGCSIVNAFLSVLQESLDNILSLDTLFAEILKSHGIAAINRWFSEKNAKVRRALQASRLIFVPVHRIAEPEHWGLLVMFKNSGKICLFDSAYALDSFGNEASHLLKWANQAQVALGLGREWPEVWSFDDSKKLSAQQSNATDCGVFVCLNALLVSLARTDYHVVNEKTGEFYRLEILRSLQSNSLCISFPCM